MTSAVNTKTEKKRILFITSMMLAFLWVLMLVCLKTFIQLSTKTQVFLNMILKTNIRKKAIRININIREVGVFKC
ncbi:hypothetical protein ES708_13311 [subsurface metagenome]